MQPEDLQGSSAYKWQEWTLRQHGESRTILYLSDGTVLVSSPFQLMPIELSDPFQFSFTKYFL